jgi:hypothetical protein
LCNSISAWDGYTTYVGTNELAFVLLMTIIGYKDGVENYLKKLNSVNEIQKTHCIIGRA